MFYCGHVFVLSVLLHLASVAVCVYRSCFYVDTVSMYFCCTHHFQMLVTTTDPLFVHNATDLHELLFQSLSVILRLFSYFKVMLGVHIQNKNRRLTALVRYIACDDIVRKLGTWPIFLLFATAYQLSRLLSG